jgi:hypothetical protein
MHSGLRAVYLPRFGVRGFFGRWPGSTGALLFLSFDFLFRLFCLVLNLLAIPALNSQALVPHVATNFPCSVSHVPGEQLFDEVSRLYAIQAAGKDCIVALDTFIAEDWWRPKDVL